MLKLHDFRFLLFALLLLNGIDMMMTGGSPPPLVASGFRALPRPHLGLEENWSLRQAYNDFVDDEMEPEFGRVRTMEKLLRVLDDEKRRRNPYPSCPTYECSRNHEYGCNPTKPGKFGLIGPCCSDICCPVRDTQFGICRPKGPCPQYKYRYASLM